METDFCKIYDTEDTCFSNSNCAWCKDDINNISHCIGDYTCYSHLN